MDDSAPIPPVFRKPQYQQRQQQQFNQQHRRDEAENQYDEQEEQTPRKGAPLLDGMSSIDLTA